MDRTDQPEETMGEILDDIDIFAPEGNDADLQPDPTPAATDDDSSEEAPETSQEESGDEDEPTPAAEEKTPPAAAEAATGDREDAPDVPPAVQRMIADAEERDRRLRERESKQRDLERQVSEASRLVEALRADPEAAMRQLGVDPQKYFKKALGIEEETDPLVDLRNEVRAMREREAQREHAFEQQRKQAELRASQEAVITKYRDLAVKEDTKKSHPHVFLIGNQRAADIMFQKARERAMDTGRWPDDLVAADLAEQGLKTDIEAIVKILRESDQYGGLFKDGKKEAEESKSQGSRGRKTLRNKDNGTTRTATANEEDLSNLSDAEFRAQVLKDLDLFE